MFQKMSDRLLSNILVNYTLPTPSMTVLSPKYQSINTVVDIETTHHFLSEGLCFKPIWPVVLVPLKLNALLSEGLFFTMHLSSTTSSACYINRFQWFLNPPDLNSAYLYLQALSEEGLSVQISVAGDIHEASISRLGFLPEATLQPPSTMLQPAVQELRELFLFPQKFLFFEVSFETLSVSPSDAIELRFSFSRSQSVCLPPLSVADVIVNAFPVVNRFKKIPLAKTQAAYEPYLIEYLEPQNLKAYSVLSVESITLKDEVTQASLLLSALFPAMNFDRVLRWHACHTFSDSRLGEWQTKILFDLPDDFDLKPMIISSAVVVTQAAYVLDKMLTYDFVSDTVEQTFVSLPVFHPAYCPQWSSLQRESFYAFLMKGFSRLLSPGEHRETFLQYIALLLPASECNLIDSALSRFSVRSLFAERRIGTRYAMLEGVSVSVALNERIMGMAKVIALCYWLRYVFFEQLSLSRVLRIECHLLLGDALWSWEAPDDTLA